MLTIYGNAMSTCTRKVLTTLVETAQPYELVVIDFAKGEHKQEAHLRRQPFGRVPTLDDDGFELFESRAMCRYLNDKVSGALVPSDLKTRATMEQWISVETSEFSPHAMKFIYQYVFKREQDAATLDAAGKALTTTCAAMGRQLGSSPYLAGGDFTLADICFMPYFEYAAATPAGEIFAREPAVTAWWSRVRERASWRKVTGKA